MTRAYLKIQDGCNAFCTYCIVPYARGRSRSMPMNDILEHLWHLSSKGYKEAVLTGIHLGAYGLDFQNGASITKLLKEIERIRPIHRIRLSSIEPTELTDEIINSASKLSALSASNKITNSASKSEKSILCDHFHIPLQSGDDSVLERMGRPYNSKFFSDLIMKIHNAVPTAAIGVDVLEGFPGESEKEFENTLNLITKLPISYLHVFPFSPRKGTPAFRFPDKVKAGTVKERCAIIRYIGFHKRKNFEESLIGKSFESVIQDKRDESTGKLIAVTSNYLSLLVDGDDKLKRQIVQTTFETIEKRGALIGKIL